MIKVDGSNLSFFELVTWVNDDDMVVLGDKDSQHEGLFFILTPKQAKELANSLLKSAEEALSNE